MKENLETFEEVVKVSYIAGLFDAVCGALLRWSACVVSELNSREDHAGRISSLPLKPLFVLRLLLAGFLSLGRTLAILGIS